MKKICTLLVLCGLFAFTVGCEKSKPTSGTSTTSTPSSTSTTPDTSTTATDKK